MDEETNTRNDQEEQRGELISLEGKGDAEITNFNKIEIVYNTGIAILHIDEDQDADHEGSQHCTAAHEADQ